MNIKESELRKKLDLVVDKLLNLGGPDNAKELEESGGEAIGFFARDFGIKEWDWPQGVGLYGLLKIMQYDKNENYKEFLHDWFVENMELGLPSRNINTTTPLLTLAELNEYYHDEKFEKLCLDWANWLMNCIPRTKEGGFQHVTSANGDRQGVRLNESEISCPLPISAFSIVPDFVVFVAMEPRSRSHPHPPRRIRLRYLRSGVFGRFTLSRLPGKSRFYYRFISSCGPTALCPRITFSISFRSDDGRSPGIVFFTALVALPISRAL